MAETRSGDRLTPDPVDDAGEVERGGHRDVLQPDLGQTGIARPPQAEAAHRQGERSLDAGTLGVEPAEGGRFLALAGLGERLVPRLWAQRHRPARCAWAGAVDAMRAGMAVGIG